MIMDSKMYYNIEEDLKYFPDNWCYIIIGGRNTGKTYSGLKHCIKNNKKFVFVKRTNKDVDILCCGNTLNKKLPEYEIDLSPMKPINRDMGTNIRAFKIDDGLGAFYEVEDDKPHGSPVGFIISLYAVGKFKGFDMSECDVIIFDEFIPKMYERANAMEGDQVMELYKTVSRDRVERGREELKLFCFANSTSIFNYTCDTLEVTDVIVDMETQKQEALELSDRGIFIRRLPTPPEMMMQEKKTGIYRAMHDTAWGRMAFDNEFSYNDFSCIRKMSLKHGRPYLSVRYRNDVFYVYMFDDKYYMTTSAGNVQKIYSLNSEMGQRDFYYAEVIDFVRACIEGRMYFQKYSMYDLIINFKKRFKIN